MIENLTQTPPDVQHSATVERQAIYFDDLQGARTARHASEEKFNSPKPENVRVAVSDIRSDITDVFKATGELAHEVSEEIRQLKEHYWSRARYVTDEHGAQPGFELDDYFRVGSNRSYPEIKEILSKEYSPDSIPGSVLEGIEAYHQVLGINPAHAATIVTELIGKGLPSIGEMSSVIARNEGLTSEKATTVAFYEFINSEVPHHINLLIDKYGYGDEAIRPNMAKNSFYPEFENQKKDVKLSLSASDAQGMIRAYDIQSRPYSEAELAMAGELAFDTSMQAATIRLQETLVSHSEQYLSQHPERAQGDLRNFSEIFVPRHNGEEMELLPNPKLLRAVVNNILPGVGRSLIERELESNEVDHEAIRRGIEIASKEFKLFKADVGQFTSDDPHKEKVELHSIYRTVCPANALFPKFLTTYLADYYAEARATQGQ